MSRSTREDQDRLSGGPDRDGTAGEAVAPGEGAPGDKKEDQLKVTVWLCPVSGLDSFETRWFAAIAVMSAAESVKV